MVNAAADGPTGKQAARHIAETKIARKDMANRNPAQAGRTDVPAVTVLMSVRDAPIGMLDRAIASVLAQTFADLEFLILDDGSRDPAFGDALERHAEGDARIRLRREPARGLTKTLNVGLAAAAGRYIARQDADDWSEPRRLERQVEYLEEHPEIAVCGANAWMHQENGAPLWATRLPGAAAEVQRALWSGNPFVHGATMFRAGAARAIGGYCEQFACSQDYDFFWRLVDSGGGANLAPPLYHYRFRLKAVSAQRAAEQARVHLATRALARDRLLGADADIAGALAEADRQMRVAPGRLGSCLKQADHRLLAGDYLGAARSYASLLGRHPTSSLAWGKLIRWFVFLTAPAARRRCFR